MAADGGEICLHLLSKRDCIRSCMRSHAPEQGQNREAMIRYIRISRDVMELSRKRKFNGGRDWGSHRGHWERSEGNGTRNSDEKNHGNGAGFGDKCGSHSGGIQDKKNSGGGGAKGGNDNNTTPPPPTRTDRQYGSATRTVRTEVGWSRDNGLIGGGMGVKIVVRP